MSQNMNFDSVNSETSKQCPGVIQCSKNGLQFVDVFLSEDLSSMCAENECLLFADDTSLTCIGDTFEVLVQNSNDRLQSSSDCDSFTKFFINSWIVQ